LNCQITDGCEVGLQCLECPILRKTRLFNSVVSSSGLLLNVMVAFLATLDWLPAKSPT
jgi:hypothetical protein